MRILIIGGSSLIGPHVARRLAERGYSVFTLTRRGCTISGTTSIRGDRSRPEVLGQILSQIEPHLVIDMVAYRRRDAETVSRLSHLVPAWIVVSSVDVYLAFARLHRTEPGTLVQTPLDESSPLRRQIASDPTAYDKLAVEQVALSSEIQSVTIFRLPMVYGAPDRSRIEHYVRRIYDARGCIPIHADYGKWRVSRVAAGNGAEAIVLGALSMQCGQRRIYNVSELEDYSEEEWCARLGGLLGWKGRAVLRRDSRLTIPFNIDTAQHLTIDSSLIRAELNYREAVHPDKALMEAACWLTDQFGAESPSPIDYTVEDAVVVSVKPK